jgi:hypothetical protein
MRKNRPLSSLARFLPLLVSGALLAGEEENPILELMQNKVIPASTIVFEASAETPADEAAWQTLTQAAQSLLEAAPGLQNPPTGKPETPWREDVAAFQEIARQIAAAVAARDTPQLEKLSDTLYQNCETCHQIYYIQKPTTYRRFAAKYAAAKPSLNFSGH